MSDSEDKKDGGSVDTKLSGSLERQWTKRLKCFSGRKNPANNELDFDSWEFIVNELELEAGLDLRAKRNIVIGSLASPAANLARSIPNADVTSLLKVLKSAYGKIADGHELLMKFFDLFQKDDEIPSRYLQRLQLLLRRIVDSGEVSPADEFKTLVRQFCRGCRDDHMLHEMDLMVPFKQLDYKDFADLFCALSEEEDRIRDKERRFTDPSRKQTVGKSQQLQQNEMAQLVEKVNALSLKLEQVTNEKAQLSNLADSGPVPPQAQALGFGRGRGAARSFNSEYRPRSRPPNPNRRILICYNCGIKGHSFRNCENQPNPARVCESLKGAQGNDQMSA